MEEGELDEWLNKQGWERDAGTGLLSVAAGFVASRRMLIGEG